MLTFLQVRIEIKKREKASCNFVVKLWLYYGSKKKKKVLKSMSGAVDLVHILKSFLWGGSISKLMNIKWLA